MKEKSAVSIGAALFAFFVFNAVYTQIVGTAHPYCVARLAVMPLVAPWYHLALPVLTVAFLYVLMAGKGWRAAGTVAFLMLMSAVGPEWVETIGRWGGNACK